MSGQGSITRQNAKQPSGAPFTSGSAINGASVNGAGKIVLGNDVGGTVATLLNNREIPLAGFSLLMSDPGNNTNITFGGGAVVVRDTSVVGFQSILGAGNLFLDWTSGTPGITFNSSIGIVRNVNELAVYSTSLGDRFLSIETATRVVKLGSIDGGFQTFMNIDDGTGVFDFSNATGTAQVSINGTIGFTTAGAVPVSTITVVGGVVTNVT